MGFLKLPKHYKLWLFLFLAFVVLLLDHEFARVDVVWECLERFLEGVRGLAEIFGHHHARGFTHAIQFTGHFQLSFFHLSKDPLVCNEPLFLIESQIGIFYV